MTDEEPVVRRVDQGLARLLPDLDRPRGWLLTMDGAPQSYVDLDDPAYLEFEYVQRLAHAIDHWDAPRAALDVLHLGGGALTLPRYLAATRPGSGQRVVEFDAELIELVREVLPWPAGITVAADDARAAVAAAGADSADVVVADVFGGDRIPAQVTSVEFLGEVRRVLRSGGLYAANLADGAPLDFLRGQLASAATLFPELCLLAEPAVLRGRRYGNLVLLASDTELPEAELTRVLAGDPFPARAVAGDRLTRLFAGTVPVTDVTAAPSPPPPAGMFSV